MSTYLSNLFETCTKYLSVSQIQMVQQLFGKYVGIFSKHDADCGRTSLIKHQKEIEDVKSFREPPRSALYHLQG
jgi:hypothetical protein